MFATIDIGTNSVLLLIGELSQDGYVHVCEDLIEVTRLGEGLRKGGEINLNAMERTFEALKRYRKLCDDHGVSQTFAIGTAAMRNASNADEFIDRARRELGLKIEIISENREAILTYKACAHDLGDDIAVIDIGGGSTEIIAQPRSPKGKMPGINTVSIPIGSVSLTENFLNHDPITGNELHMLRTAIHRMLEENVEPALYARPNDLTFVATAGTATTLMSMHLELEDYSASKVHGSSLRISDVRNIIDRLVPKSIEERKKIKGLMPARADVILAGAVLLHDVMSYLGYATVKISDRGVKWGLFYEKFCN